MQGKLTEHNLAVHQFKHVEKFSPSQRWRTTVGVPFPSYPFQESEIAELSSLWKNLVSIPNSLKLFLNLHCLETNFLEGTFMFKTSVSFL
jgi:hypothetical protein